jgi:hypothetical protein
MALMPRNVPLAVTWRLLLLAAAVTVIVAIGMHEYGWQPIGPKRPLPEKNDPIGVIIRQEMQDETPWAEPSDEANEPAPPAPPPPAAATPAPAPAATPAPKPADKPAVQKKKPKMDEDSLENFLNQQPTSKKKKKTQ